MKSLEMMKVGNHFNETGECLHNLMKAYQAEFSSSNCNAQTKHSKRIRHIAQTDRTEQSGHTTALTRHTRHTRHTVKTEQSGYNGNTVLKQQPPHLKEISAGGKVRNPAGPMHNHLTYMQNQSIQLIQLIQHFQPAL